MKKIYKSLIALTVGTFIGSTAYAQLPESFEGGVFPPTGWVKFESGTGTVQSWTTSATAQSGVQAAYVQYENVASGLAIDWLVSPAVMISAGTPTLSYWDRESYTSDYGGTYDVLISTTSQSATASFTLLTTRGEATVTPTTYKNRTIDLSAYAGQSVYIAFRMTNDDGDNWFLDNISLIGACAATPVAGTITGPSAVNSGSAYNYTVTPTTGNVQWYKGTSATGPWTAIAGATMAVNQPITATGGGTVFLTVIASGSGCVSDTANAAFPVVVTLMGDDVCTAIPLSMGTSPAYYLNGATVQTGEVVPPTTLCSTNAGWCDVTLDNTMWFTFVAPASGNVKIQAPGYDTQLAIWKAAACNDLLSAATATLVAANDDDANYATNGVAQWSSIVRAACLTPGATYYVQLDSYDPATITQSTSIVLTDMGAMDASFTGLAANYCVPAASSSLTPATAGGIFTVNTSTAAVTSFSPVAAGTFTVNYSIFGCNSMSTTVVALTPTVNASASNSVLCAGQSTTLTATGTATSFTWSPVGGNASTAVVSPTANATYTVMGSNSGCSASAMVSLTVNAVPTLSVSSSTSSLCAGASATLTAAGATNYTWSPVGGNAAMAVVSPTANALYTVTGESLGCSATGTLNIDVYNMPNVMVSPVATTICAGTSVTLTATGADTYAWNNGDMTAMSVVTPTANSTYTVTGTTACGTMTFEAMVDVTSSAVVNATSTSSIICTGETATLTATGASSYTWAPGGEMTASIEVSPTSMSTYTVIGSSTCGTATTTITQDVSLCTGIVNHTASTSKVSLFPNPNTGSVNITISNELTGSITLRVYDAIGKLVMSENLTNDANTINTSKLEAGIYIYKVINNNQEVKVGKMIKH